MAMKLETGQTVWLAFAHPNSSDGKPVASVHRAVVIDAENRIVRHESGYVTVCQTWSVEQPHPTEAEAWAANADLLGRHVVAVEQKAQECRRAAVKAQTEVLERHVVAVEQKAQECRRAAVKAQMKGGD